jgi:branched-chain amino acid transport system permease protein
MLLETLVSGLFLAAVYALAAFGLTIVFGVLDILNFAHGALLVLGAYLVVALVARGVGFGFAAPVAVLAIALVGLVLQRTLFRRVERQAIAGLILSIGLIAIADTIILQVWGPDPYHLARLVEGSFRVGDSALPKDHLLIIAIAIIALGAAEVGIARAGWGKLLRATAEDDEAASLQGVPVGRVKTVAFTAGAGLAAFAGILIGTTTPIEPQLGENILIKAFIIIIIGGAGSTGGTLIGAAILGITEAVGTAYLDQTIAQLVPLVVLALVLFFRPQGVFGRASART